MSTQAVLTAVLTLAAVVLCAVLALTLWQIRKTIRDLGHRIDTSLAQLDLTAEEVRKTAIVAREFLAQAEKGAANATRITDGIVGFGKALESTASLAACLVSPILGRTAGGAGAGVLAALSYVLNRFTRKEE